MASNSGKAPSVVAAVIERGGQFLICKRPRHKRHGGLWEFPGGKRLDGESVERAIRRELAEELNLEVLSVGEILFAARDPDSPFIIEFIRVEAQGEPQAMEHMDIMWCPVSKFEVVKLAPPDTRFVQEFLKKSLE